MSLRQLFIAAALLLSAVYLKMFLPVYSEQFMPAVRQVLAEEQAALRVPETWMSWLSWS